MNPKPVGHSHSTERMDELVIVLHHENFVALTPEQQCLFPGEVAC